MAASEPWKMEEKARGETDIEAQVVKPHTVATCNPTKHSSKLSGEVDMSHTICIVPQFVRQGKKKEGLYRPRVISIGPCHMGRTSLNAMERHKAKFLENLKSRVGDERLNHYSKEMENLADKAKKCYEKEIALDKKQFSDVLLMDGCFIIELLYKFYSRDSQYMLSGGWSGHLIWIDLLKIENQIPFFVLEKLFNLLPRPKEDKLGLFRDPQDPKHTASSTANKHPLRQLALMYLMEGRAPFRFSRYRENAESAGEVHHLLHLYYLYYTPPCPLKTKKIDTTDRFLRPWDFLAVLLSSDKWIRYFVVKMKRSVSSSRSDRESEYPSKVMSPLKVPCVTQLQEDGVKFIKKKKAMSFYDVEFNRFRGLMKIPRMFIDEETLAISENLIAYEECKGEKKYLISYAFLMDCLVDSPKDVAVLRQHKIIVSDQDDEELVDFFNKLCRSCYLTYENYEYVDLSRDVQNYCMFKLFRGRAYLTKLKRDYFSSPWAFISFVGGVTLLGLTITQTYFTMYPS